MKLKIRGTGEGAVLDIIEPGQGSGVEDSVVTSIAVVQGKELNVNLPTATVVEQIEYGDVVDTPVPPAGGAPDTPGGGQEGSPAGGEGAPPTSGEGEGGGAPADQGQGGEAPTTSAASEKPLYAIANSEADGFTVPEGFTASGLETPEGVSLFHYEGDTAGQTHTFDVGSVEDVTLYAEADDNEKPVKVPDAEAAQADSETQPTA